MRGYGSQLWKLRFDIEDDTHILSLLNYGHRNPSQKPPYNYRHNSQRDCFSANANAIFSSGLTSLLSPSEFWTGSQNLRIAPGQPMDVVCGLSPRRNLFLSIVATSPPSLAPDWLNHGS